MSVVEISVDLTKKSSQKDVIFCRQGELNAVTIKADVKDGGKRADISGFEGYFECVSPDGTCVSEIVDNIDGNIITYTISELVSACAGNVKFAYFALKKHSESGAVNTQATTNDFALRILPDSASQGTGITKAYSSEIEKMLETCFENFNAAEQAREERVSGAIDNANAATERANAAADAVSSAVEGDLDPLFLAFLDTKKNVESGFVGWDFYMQSFMSDDEFIEAVVE